MASLNDTTRKQLMALREEVKHLRSVVRRLCPSLETLLSRRGFTVYKKEQADDLLIPTQRYLRSYYGMLHKYSFRLFLRDVIKHQELFTQETVTRYASPEVTGQYLEYLRSVKMIRRAAGGYVLAQRPVRSFGPTLEWYIAEVFKREFAAGAVWGVKFKRPRVGGDYDVIAKIDAALFYLEVKSSPPKQIYDSEITAFLDRVEDLSPDVAVFLMDTELRMKDKIVPMFEQEFERRSGQAAVISRMERELFELPHNTFIINAREDMVQNIRTVLSWYYRRNRAVPGDDGEDTPSGRTASPRRTSGRHRRLR